MTAASRPSANFLDPAALMSIRNLELRARTVVEGFWHGLHRSPYHGFSVEFTEYRPIGSSFSPAIQFHPRDARGGPRTLRE